MKEYIGTASVVAGLFLLGSYEPVQAIECSQRCGAVAIGTSIIDEDSAEASSTEVIVDAPPYSATAETSLELNGGKSQTYARADLTSGAMQANVVMHAGDDPMKYDIGEAGAFLSDTLAFAGTGRVKFSMSIEGFLQVECALFPTDLCSQGGLYWFFGLSTPTDPTDPSGAWESVTGFVKDDVDTDYVEDFAMPGYRFADTWGDTIWVVDGQIARFGAGLVTSCQMNLGIPVGRYCNSQFGNTSWLNISSPDGVSFSSASSVLLDEPYRPVDDVPEPSGLVMLGLGLAGLGVTRRRGAV